MLHEHLRDRVFDAPGSWAHRSCNVCDHTWLDPRPSASHLARLYATYFTHTVPEASNHTVSRVGRSWLSAYGYPTSSSARGWAFRLIPGLRDIGLFQRTWIHWDPPRHLHGFSPRSLATAARRAGFQSSSIRTSARAARFAWTASRTIGSTGRANIGRIRGPLQWQSIAFQALESVLITVWQSTGEELILTATQDLARNPSAMLPTLDIVIVNWNTGDDLRACLKSLAGTNRSTVTVSRVVVVDNGSTDESAENLDAGDLRSVVIENQENRGFAAACNRGAARSTVITCCFSTRIHCSLRTRSRSPCFFSRIPRDTTLASAAFRWWTITVSPPPHARDFRRRP